ncbi:MAG: hypothetical protein ACOZE5_17180 [Verrucomicrobiota bacterium]
MSKKLSAEGGPPRRVDHIAIVAMVALVALACIAKDGDVRYPVALLAVVMGLLWGPSALKSVIHFWRQ